MFAHGGFGVRRAFEAIQVVLGLGLVCFACLPVSSLTCLAAEGGKVYEFGFFLGGEPTTAGIILTTPRV